MLCTKNKSLSQLPSHPLAAQRRARPQVPAGSWHRARGSGSSWALCSWAAAACALCPLSNASRCGQSSCPAQQCRELLPFLPSWVLCLPAFCSGSCSFPPSTMQLLLLQGHLGAASGEMGPASTQAPGDHQALAGEFQMDPGDFRKALSDCFPCSLPPG